MLHYIRVFALLMFVPAYLILPLAVLQFFASSASLAGTVSCETAAAFYPEAFNRVHEPTQYRASLEAIYTNVDSYFEFYPFFNYAALLLTAKLDYLEFNHQEQQTIPDFEHLAIWSYTSLDSGVLNTALRTQATAPLSMDLLTLKQGIECGLSQLPDFKGPVLRGLQENSLPAGFFRSHYPGSIVKYSAFTSTTACAAQASRKQLLIHSKHGKKIAAFSAAGDTECEVLFRPDTCFEVVKAYGEYGHRKGIRAELNEVDCPAPLSKDWKSIKNF